MKKILNNKFDEVYNDIYQIQQLKLNLAITTFIQYNYAELKINQILQEEITKQVLENTLIKERELINKINQIDLQNQPSTSPCQSHSSKL